MRSAIVANRGSPTSSGASIASHSRRHCDWLAVATTIQSSVARNAPLGIVIGEPDPSGAVASAVASVLST